MFGRAFGRRSEGRPGAFRHQHDAVFGCGTSRRSITFYKKIVMLEDSTWDEMLGRVKEGSRRKKKIGSHLYTSHASVAINESPLPTPDPSKFLVVINNRCLASFLISSSHRIVSSEAHRLPRCQFAN